MNGAGHRMQSAEFTRNSVLVAVRLPIGMRARLSVAVQEEDVTVSQLIRRSLKRTLVEMGYLK